MHDATHTPTATRHSDDPRALPTITDAPRLRMIVGGDVMLGRAVARRVHTRGVRYPLGSIAPYARAADVRIANLECPITSASQTWRGAPKAFYFRAPPRAIDCLTAVGIDLVSLANNHALDYGVAGLTDTLSALDCAGIAHAGAGIDLDAALAPAVVERRGVRIGMTAFCDHQPDYAAGPGRPGIAHLDLADRGRALRTLQTALAAQRERGVHWPVLSLHWGPNWAERPAPALIALAHAAIDMGWRMVYGHGAHIFQGIEIHRGAAILYGAGDLVDDYAVHPTLRNDRQVLYDLLLGPDGLERLTLHPLVIEAFRTRLADEVSREWIAARMRERSALFGTTITGEDPLTVSLTRH